MWYLLALSLCAQAPPPDAFDRAVADLVVWADPDPGAPTERLIGCLSCPRYDCRTLAEETLRALGPAAYVALLRAERRHRDPEVRHRAARLRRCVYCEHCGNTGECPNPFVMKWDYWVDVFDRDMTVTGCPVCPPREVKWGHVKHAACGFCGRQPAAPPPPVFPWDER